MTPTPARVRHHDLVVRGRRERGVHVVTVSGEADLRTEHHLRPGLAHALEGSGGALVLDLTDLTFCSARGISILADITSGLTHRGVTLAVAGLSRLQAHVWLLTGLPIPTAYGTVTEAVDRLTPQHGSGDTPAGQSTPTRHLEEELRGLHQAMTAGVTIEQATGQLMEQFGYTAEEAFEQLTQVARSSHRTLHGVARDLTTDVTGHAAAQPEDTARPARQAAPRG